MNPWRALRDAMRVRRTPSIGPDDVDRLIAGEPTGPEHRGLAALLSAAKAPPSPGELAGERAAVADFVAAYREGQSTSLPTGRHRARKPMPARAAAVKVAASVAVLVVSGSAVAAETGHLPATAQRYAHDLFASVGVPAPRRPARTAEPVVGHSTPAATDPTGTTPPAHTSGAATPASPSARPEPAVTETPKGADARGLCEAWAAQREPQAKAMAAKSRQELVTLAGGEDRIPDFCAPLLDEEAAESASPAPSDESGQDNERPRPTATPHD